MTLGVGPGLEGGAEEGLTGQFVPGHALPLDFCACEGALAVPLVRVYFLSFPLMIEPMVDSSTPQRPGCYSTMS